jgi:hypothetical protein
LEKVSAAGEAGKKADTVRKRKRSDSSNSSTTANTQQTHVQQAQSYPSSQTGSRGPFRGSFRGQGRGRGWDTSSSYSSGSFHNVGRGGGQPSRFQDRGGPHRGGVEGPVALLEAISEAGPGLGGRLLREPNTSNGCRRLFSFLFKKFLLISV